MSYLLINIFVWIIFSIFLSLAAEQIEEEKAEVNKLSYYF